MKAKSHPEGAIDLSQGTPVDPTPDFIQRALQEASNTPGYPVTTGSAELRSAIASYCREVLGAQGDFDVLPVIGSKEFVAWLPFMLRSKRVLIPEIAYPTYRVGAIIAGSHVEEVGIEATTWNSQPGDLIWVNTPSNPTGRVHSVDEIKKALEHRSVGAIVAIDECYFSFGDAKKPISTFSLTEGNNRNFLTVHSLSKRSNLAGYRGAFVAGDPDLISRLLEIRKHAGMMAPAPVQHAVSVALGDEAHVEKQAKLYAQRRRRLTPALARKGFRVDHSEAGLYIWCSNGAEDWAQVAWFADRGILVTPGNFYGKGGASHIRIALTATDSKVDEAIERILAS